MSRKPLSYYGIKKGSYKISGVNGGSNTTFLMFMNGDKENYFICTDGEKIESVIDDSILVFPCIRVCQNVEVNNVKIYPMICKSTVEDSAYEPYTGETITVTNDTESPAFGLKSHKGITNIISPANVKCVYPTNESGKGVLDSLYNKDKMLTEQNKNLSVIGKCKNLLNPTLQTSEQNGVTCTNNGDGTYTFNGTASSDTYFVFENITKFEDGKYKIVGSKNQDLYCNALRRLDDVMEYSKLQEKYIPTAYLSNDVYKLIQIGIVIISGTTLTNEIVKPMLTTNLSATYDDFVPYTGDGDTLTHDVAHLNKSLEVLRKCKNLLKPTLQTATQNGVTCTNNGDGTYTLNGTASANCYFILNSNFNLESGKSYKLIGNPGKSDGSSSGSDYRLDFYNGNTYTGEYGIGAIITAGTTNKIQIIISNGVTISNLVVKPMITTNLSATYDDFVPYTGEGETLTHDVAEIKNDLGGLTFSASGTTLTITDGTNTWTLGANS